MRKESSPGRQMQSNSSFSGSMQYSRNPSSWGVSSWVYLAVREPACIIMRQSEYNIYLCMKPDTLIDLPKCNINVFKLKQKGVVFSGPCSVSKTPTNLIITSEKTSLEIARKSVIARLQEINYTTYLFLHECGSIYAISIPASEPLKEEFYKVLTSQLEVLDFFQMPPDLELRQKITAECPLAKPGEQELGATNDDKLNQIGQGIGNVFGGISSVLDMDKMNKESNEVVTKMSKSIFGERTLSKWEMFKNKCSALNDKVTDAIKPVSVKCREIVTGIGKNFESSDNTFIKNVRDYSKKTETALNQGYDKGDAPRRASYIPPGQSGGKSQSTGGSSKIISEEKVNQRKSLL